MTPNTLNDLKSFTTVADYATGPVAQTAAAGVLLSVALLLVLRGRRRPTTSAAPVAPAAVASAAQAPADAPTSPTSGGSLRSATSATSATVGRRWLIGLAVAAAVAVAGLGGVRSFEAVSAKFDSALVPLTADGMIIACTALRLAALTRGWRLPGSLVTTYGFIGGTVWLNIAAAHGWTDAVAHALAPVSYAVLVEMLAHLLRLHLRLTQPTRPRVTALTWFTSPVVTTRVWLHLARTGSQDPVAARALVQQLIRMSSRLQTVCPSPPLHGWWPAGQANAARSAALQTIRDGLLTAHELATLLPTDQTQLAPGALLALVDAAALAHTASLADSSTASAPVHRAADHPAITGAPEAVHASRTTTRASSAPRSPAPTAPTALGSGLRVRDERTDDELVAELHQHAEHNGGPMSQREVMRLLGVGTPKAKRLAVQAGWARPATPNDRHDHESPEHVPGQLALVNEPSQPQAVDATGPASSASEAALPDGPPDDEADEFPARTSR